MQSMRDIRLAIAGMTKAPIRVFFGYDEKDEIQRLRDISEPFVYVDHAYFNRGYENANFRVIYNTIHQTKELDCPPDRRALFNVQLEDWKEGNTVLLIPAPPNPLWFHNDPDWNSRIAHELLEIDREVMVKAKKTNGLGNSIDDCYCIVSHSSVAAVEAACNGVPVVCPDTCPAFPIGTEDIYHPITPNRDKWVNTLTYSQFTLDEMRNGFAWGTIKEMHGL